MSTLLHAELRKSYSWWWDSHITPKNSKWLQEDLADMDFKVKAMIKLIEEDAISFPLRAEMYYKKRPELLKLVEEFYQAYQALAERYDRATGALRHAHRTMAATFPYHIPLALPDESSSDAKLGIHISNLPSCASGVPKSLDASKHEFGSEALGTNKGLKQFAEILSPREGTARVKLPEGKVRKGLGFQEEEARAHVKLVEKNANEEEKLCHNKHPILSKNVQNLADVMTKFESEKEAAIVQNQLSKESISSLEIEVSMLKDETRKLNNEMEMAMMKLSSAEKHCQALEKENHCLQVELEEADLKFAQLDRSKVSLEEEVSFVKAINSSLNEHNLACALKIKHLKDEIIFLKETNDKLEDEIENYAKSNKILQQELYSLKEDRNELDLKMEETTLHVESLEILVNGLRHTRIELIESCKNLQDENLLLLNKLKDTESVIEKNVILENYLHDAKAEVEELREHIKALKDSFFTLNASDATHVCVKAALASQLEAFSENVENLTKKNAFLENSLDDAKTKLEGLRSEPDELEHPCDSPSDANLYLLSQNNCVISQVDNVHMSLVNQEAAHALLEDNHLNLLKEKDVSVEKVLKLEDSLNVMLKEDESLIQSTSAHLANLESQLLLLQNSQLREEELEAAQQTCFSHIIEIFILKRCLCDMRCSLIEKLGCNSHIKSYGIQLTASDNQTHLSDHCCENQFLHEEKSIYLGWLKQTELEKFPLTQEPGMVNRKSLLLQQEQDDAHVMRSELEKQVATLLEASACKDKELARAYEENRMLSEALNRCSSEVGVLRLREEFLSSELKKEKEEVERCEEETMELLREVQFSVVNAAVLEEKMIELEASWESLELSSMAQMKTLNEDVTLRNAYLDGLEIKIVDLENENVRLRAKLNELVLLFNSLGNAIAKVEGHVCQLAKHAGNKDNPSAYLPKATNHQKNPVKHATMGEFYHMQEMLNRVEELQKLVIHTKGHLDQERLQSAANFDSAMREIKQLKLKQSHNRGKETPIGEHGMVIKDIHLDQISNSCRMASEVIKVPQEDWSRRLASNAEKLSALQISALELELKMDKLGKKICCNSSKRDSLRARLKMAEEAISELVDSNNMRMLKALERARRGSSKIGKLELELEKMHHIFVKLEEECGRDKTRGGDGGRVILRDFLYGRKVRQETKIIPLCCKP